MPPLSDIGCSHNGHFCRIWFLRVIFQSFLTPCGGVLNVTKFFWPNVKVLVNTLLTSYKPSSMDVFSSRNRCFSHFSIWSIYKVGCRQVAQYISRLALSIVFKTSFFRVQWSSNIFCQLLKTESTWILKTPLIVPTLSVVLTMTFNDQFDQQFLLKLKFCMKM